MTQTIAIDIRGQICPSCLLLTLKEINRNADAMRAGAVRIAVLTDDRQATATIPATAERMGFRAAVRHDPAGYRIDICGTACA
jgi:TusA-related sulfurtransferase